MTLDDVLRAISEFSLPDLHRIIKAAHSEEIRRALTHARDASAERLKTFEEKQER